MDGEGGEEVINKIYTCAKMKTKIIKNKFKKEVRK